MLERVQKIMSNAGYCSRRKAETLIEQGKVKVNGKTITLGDKADKDKDKISIEGEQLKFENKIYLVLNKPPGYVCSKSDPQINKNIYQLIFTKERLYSIGRLDTMSEGLIILTNDGNFANKVMHPRYEVEKEYKAVLDRPFLRKDKEEVERGIEIEDNKGNAYKTKSIKVKMDKEDNKIIFFALHEGKNRIIRRVLKKLGYRVAKLIRTRIGNIELKNLAIGKYRPLTKKELSFLN